MFFFLSKVLWLVTAPSNLIYGAATLGAALLFTRFSRGGRGLIVGALAAGLLVGSGPFGAYALRWLETRFPPLAAEAPAPDGIVVLGGAVGESAAGETTQVLLTDAAERMTEGLALALKYPKARVVFTGGTSALFGSARTEADAARRLWAAMGAPLERFVFEDKSRNTVENATLTRELVKPKPGERWLLVTSAHHMPRAVGVFRKAGWSVVAAPVDYRTGKARLPIVREWSAGLSLADLAAHEWLGLVAYRLTGKTDALLPAP